MMASREEEARARCIVPSPECAREGFPGASAGWRSVPVLEALDPLIVSANRALIEGSDGRPRGPLKAARKPAQGERRRCEAKAS